MGKETKKQQDNNLQAEIRKNEKEPSPKTPISKQPVNNTKSKPTTKSPKNSSKNPEINNSKNSKNKQQNMQVTNQKPLIKPSSKIKKCNSETLKIIGNETEIKIDLKKNKTKKNNRNPLKEVTKSIDNIK